MKAILIDPEAKTVSEVDYSGDWKDINTIIGSRSFDCVRLDGDTNDGLFVDDEGLMAESGFVFQMNDVHPLVGKGLIIGCDDEGDSISTSLKVSDIKVSWYGENSFN